MILDGHRYARLFSHGEVGLHLLDEHGNGPLESIAVQSLGPTTAGNHERASQPLGQSHFVLQTKRPELVLRHATQGNVQGQRTLSAFSGKDLHQEADTPSCHATLHDVALFARVLLDQAECHAA